MGQSSGLSAYPIIAFVPIANVEAAKTFYRDKLGLRLVSEELPFALVFDLNGIMLRLAIGKNAQPLPGTVLGWRVPEVAPVVKALTEAGITFERYGFVKQDELGIWDTPTGARVAWFKDPDGNVLSLSEHPEDKA
jgi:catechol 2,3-dioxygenase-like lactoylglutathione lyase family enzyme